MKKSTKVALENIARRLRMISKTEAIAEEILVWVEEDTEPVLQDQRVVVTQKKYDVKENKWKEEVWKGELLRWGVSVEEYDAGPGTYTTGIVKRTDGSVEEVYPSQIRFVTEDDD